MKRTVVVMLFALLSFSAFSQVSRIVKGGLNMSNFNDVDGTDMKIGYQVGLGLDFPIDKIWSLQPSLLFTTKGAKNDITVAGVNVGSWKMNPMYIEMPVMLAARINVAGDVNVVFSAGPYIAYGVGGKYTLELVGESGDSKIFGNDKTGDLDAKRFDAGLGVGVALELSHFVIGLNGELGLTKMADSDVSKIYLGDSPKNINFAATVGFKF